MAGRHETSGVSDEVEIARRVKAMREADIVELMRDTVTHLSVLADRLDAIAGDGEAPVGKDNSA